MGPSPGFPRLPAQPITTPYCSFHLIYVSMHQKLGSAHCKLTWKEKVKINTMAQNEDSNPVLNII